MTVATSWNCKKKLCVPNKSETSGRPWWRANTTSSPTPNLRCGHLRMTGAVRVSREGQRCSAPGT